MIKFSTWLDDNYGMATRLVEKLNKKPFTVNPTCVSNVKSGRRLLPVRWMPIIVKLSKGHFTLADLIAMRLRYAKR